MQQAIEIYARQETLPGSYRTIERRIISTCRREYYGTVQPLPALETDPQVQAIYIRLYRLADADDRISVSMHTITLDGEVGENL